MFGTIHNDPVVVDIIKRLLTGETVEKVTERYDSRPAKIRAVFEKGYAELRDSKLLEIAIHAGDQPPASMGWSLTHARPHVEFWLRQLERFQAYNLSIFKRNGVFSVKFDKDHTETVLRASVDFNYFEKITEYKKLISNKQHKSRFLPFHDWLIAKGYAKAFEPSHRIDYGDFENDTVFIVTPIES